MVPDGWFIEVVANLFDVQLGKMLNQKAKELQPHYTYLTNFNVRWGCFDLSKLNTMHFSEKEIQKFTLKKGDLIMCEGGEVGRCAIWIGEISNCYYQKALHRLRVKGEINAEYFQTYMRYIAGTKRLEDYTGRTSIAHLTREKLLKIPVLTPPLVEQNKIAKILTTWDKAIATTEKLLANSQHQKKSLMQQLLTGKKRFPEFDGEWEKLYLKDIATIIMGASPSSGAYNESGEGLPLLQGNADIKDRVSMPRVYTSQVTRECEVNDILIGVRAPVGSVARSMHHACIGRGIAAIRAKEYFIQKYIYFWLLYFEPRWERLSQGSTFESVNSNDVKTLHLNIPLIDEQRKIAVVLSTSDSEIETLKKKLDCLKKQKKALMQQLLTGKRRVSV